jgi:SAM-dependent methyltransferase
MTIAGIRGETPCLRIHKVDAAAKEREKYSELWRDVPEYRTYSPGLENVERFMSVMKPAYGATLIDVGCGTGGAGLKLTGHGLNVTYLDITDAGLDPQIDRKRFIESAIWKNWRGQRWFDYGFCCDVMEHIPTEYTMLSLKNIIDGCMQSWFQIAFVPDEFGRAVGAPLHLTVQPFTWWRDRIGALGTLTDARDLGAQGVFVVARR